MALYPGEEPKPTFGGVPADQLKGTASVPTVPAWQQRSVFGSATYGGGQGLSALASGNLANSDEDRRRLNAVNARRAQAGLPPVTYGDSGSQPQQPWNSNGSGTTTIVVGDPGNQTDGSADAQNEANKAQQEWAAKQSYEDAMAWANQVGMGDFLKKYYPAVVAGSITVNGVIELWRDTDMYKQRFPAMAALAKRGYRLSEGQYIDMERQYRTQLKEAGVGADFYGHNDLAQLMINDVSPAEAARRVQIAVNAVQSKDPQMLSAFDQYYGIKKKDLVEYYLDPKKKLPQLEKMAAAAAIGSEALRSDIDVGKNYAESLVGKGITQGQAREAFGTVAQTRGDVAAVGGLYDTNISERQQVNAALDLSPKATEKIRKLASKERGRFSGAAGGAKSAFGNTDTNAGMF